MFHVGVESKICRSDLCEIEGIHPRHRVPKRKRERKERQILREQWERAAPDALKESVLRAVGDLPKMVSWITRDVVDDYGSVHERTIYKYVDRLLDERQIVGVQIWRRCWVFMRPTSRMLRDREALRDYVLGQVEFAPCTSNVRIERSK